jgi:HEPN domain-containing protein
MSKQLEQARLFLRKARANEALLDEVCGSTRVTDEIVGFHFQQAAEKFLKALLCAAAVRFPRTHNLRLLMDLIADAGHPLPPELDDLDALTPYGTMLRYEDPVGGEALDRGRSMDMIRALRRFVEQRLQ